MPKIIAFYLPQYHPIAENNEWWGPGFTEWHNVARARPLFAGHQQPKMPGELGFYDLRLAQTRIDQAALAQEHGIYGFCYWHYWFAGKRLLETPIEEVLKSDQPAIPFCLGWANESWTGVWHGAPNKVLADQQYPDGDAEAHYALLRRFFKDPRYICKDGKPVFYVYKPRLIPADTQYLAKLRVLAQEDGFPDLHIVGTWSPNPKGRFDSASALGLDAAVITNITGRDSQSKLQWIFSAIEKFKHIARINIGPKRIDYQTAVKAMLPDPAGFDFTAYNCVVSNWDNTPRSGRRGLVFTGSTPGLFSAALQYALENTKRANAASGGDTFVFLKSWNEWAEGNFVEPDQVHGRAYLEAVDKAVRAVQEQ
jgi:hypothetical protein